MNPDNSIPVRSFMDDPKTKWRTGRPNYDIVNAKYLKERKCKHKAGSLEKLTENLVKTWEMEVTHKIDKKDWGTIDPNKFGICVNGGPRQDVDSVIKNGNYNLSLHNCPLYDASKETYDSSNDLFFTSFPGGFAWELLEVLSGPPKVTFTWRNWGTWAGPFREIPPSGETLEMTGVTISQVDDTLRILDVQVYFDPNPMLAKMLGHTSAKCPFSLQRSKKQMKYNMYKPVDNIIDQITRL